MNTTHKAATSPVSTPRRVLSYDDDSDEDLRPRTSTPVRRHRRRNTIARMDLVTALTPPSFQYSSQPTRLLCQRRRPQRPWAGRDPRLAGWSSRVHFSAMSFGFSVWRTCLHPGYFSAPSCVNTVLINVGGSNKCYKQYVGETSRKLKDRLNDHKSNISTNKKTAIAIHFHTVPHTC